MTTALLEIVDLGDGEIVLQRAEEEGVEPTKMRISGTKNP